ncbi:hypothetical protein PC2016_1699 [Pseudoalteromonas carrageenovora]|uniref:Transmembrane protein n=1 Tax=Pseudoalteromonas carrageenovora IAM 12662 TaxID=1314868 RepID=A0A2K4X9M2_PSEVC|nr:DUF3025 domain-containing protein [Pseudoalteromonas carrageenovora]MBE0383355.1 hypothetical protein [Pseudoalteromonas carrageenovora IAM 12662]QBJ71910.1 hypothetical protein PC2016_1699 [Pseudoalteromonas carrageenovora]GEB70124.1 hypothetical protein PCA01_08340 [Pseudoalteromonas carrageenovora]SOU41012.1 conserved protein of unknown function [Pseudoalteromonas carrageenovora IAM 12662]
MKRFTPPEQWQVSSLQTGAFSHLRELFKVDELTNWPAPQWFSPFLKAINANNIAISFEDDAKVDFGDRYYEQVIFETGVVPTRAENWHDLFGGFIWCLFPKTKALINQRHVQDIAQYGLQKRTKHRNALTLFDECGVVLAISDTKWIELLREHQWKAAFVDNKNEWGKTIKPFMFGHANYEMLTKPYIGLTGKALFVSMPDEIFCKDLVTQYQYLDQALYEMINTDNCLADNKQLSPLPLLGVPGWHDENQDASFYDNTDYFRAKRRIRT